MKKASQFIRSREKIERVMSKVRPRDACCASESDAYAQAERSQSNRLNVGLSFAFDSLNSRVVLKTRLNP